MHCQVLKVKLPGLSKINSLTYGRAFPLFHNCDLALAWFFKTFILRTRAEAVFEKQISNRNKYCVDERGHF